jgi:hypothetical protein
MQAGLFLIRNTHGHLSLAPWQMLHVCGTIVLEVFGLAPPIYTQSRLLGLVSL